MIFSSNEFISGLDLLLENKFNAIFVIYLWQVSRHGSLYKIFHCENNFKYFPYDIGKYILDSYILVLNIY